MSKSPPKHLGPIGRKKWKSIVKRLGEVKPADIDDLILLCDTWETYEAARADVRQRGTAMLSDKNGRWFANPNCNIMATAHKLIVRLEKSLGLGPAPRTDRDEQDEMAKAIDGE